MKPNSILTLLVSSLIVVGCNDNRTRKPEVTGTKFYEKQDCSVMTAPETVTFLTDKTLECGLVTVPVDWSKPKGDTIKVAVYRLPTTSSNPALDPVVYLDGGPGDSAVTKVNEFATGEFAYLRERSDVIIIDQRGTGYSQPALFCPEEFGVDVDSDVDIDEAASLVAITSCKNRLLAEGVNFANYNSKNNALDVDAVRQALDYDEWNLYGVSYGSRLALTVMREKPEGIKSVILDSVFPPQVNGLSEVSYTLYWAIDQIASNCANDDKCNSQVSDVKGLIESGIARLVTSEIGGLDAASYVQILVESIAEPALIQGIEVVANGSDEEVQALIESFLEDDSFDNDNVGFDLSLAPARLYPLFSGATGMAYSVVCSEEFPFLNTKAAPDLSGSFSLTSQQVIDNISVEFDSSLCSVWETPAADVSETQAVTSNIPTLILTGTADTSTPPEWSKIAALTLPRSQYVEFEGLTHGLLGSSDCINDITVSFLSSPFETVDSSCTANFSAIKYTFQ